MVQVEIQVRKIYCINRAVPTLPINIEDAARSEAEIEEALKVKCYFPLAIEGVPQCWKCFNIFL